MILPEKIRFSLSRYKFIWLSAILLLAAAVWAVLLLSSKPATDEAKITETNVPTESAELLPQFTDQAASYSKISDQPNKNLFPDISDPTFYSVSEEKVLTDSDHVASFVYGGDSRAYPLRYIYFHHIVNDKFGSRPILISYCGICNAAVAQDPVVDGQTLSFGVLGTLFRSNMVMYDRQTDTQWIQVTGEAIEGKLKGKKLMIVPGMEITTWGEYKQAYPGGKVLKPVDKYASSYQQFSKEVPKQSLSTGILAPLDQVLGIEVRGLYKAYSKGKVKEEVLVSDSLNGWSLLVVADPDDGGVRIFRRFLDGQVYNFELQGGKILDLETGSEWNFQGEAVAGAMRGKTLTKPGYVDLYFRSWQAFYPTTETYP